MSCRDVRRRRIRAQRIYRLLVRLYPAGHRHAFGEQMTQAFGDHYRDVIDGRGRSRARFWLAVLADTGVSLLTEHAAEIKTPGRSAVARLRRHRARMTGNRPRRQAAPRRGIGQAVRDAVDRPGSRSRRGRRGRSRYRRSTYRRTRVLIRTRHHLLAYRGRLGVLAVVTLLSAIAFGIGTAAGHPAISALAAGLVVFARLGTGLRLTRAVPAGRHGSGPASPGGASVREPRRPLPMSPAGSAARPRPEDDPPGQVIALI
jgi:hypothetical protein